MHRRTYTYECDSNLMIVPTVDCDGVIVDAEHQLSLPDRTPHRPTFFLTLIFYLSTQLRRRHAIQLLFVVNSFF